MLDMWVHKGINNNNTLGVAKEIKCLKKNLSQDKPIDYLNAGGNLMSNLDSIRYRNIVDNLREAREFRGIDKITFSTLLNKPSVYVNNYESYTKELSILELLHIVNELKVYLDDILSPYSFSAQKKAIEEFEWDISVGLSNALKQHLDDLRCSSFKDIPFTLLEKAYGRKFLGIDRIGPKKGTRVCTEAWGKVRLKLQLGEYND